MRINNLESKNNCELMKDDYMELHLIKRNYRNKKIFIILLTSLFIFSQELREGLLGNTFATINVLSLFSVSLLILNNFNELNKLKFTLFYVAIIIYIFTASLYEDSLFTIIKCIIAFIFPLILIIQEVNNNSFENIFKLTILTLNTVIIIITIIGICEIIFGIKINNYISIFMSPRTQEQIIANSMSDEAKRLYSFMGHPLFNTELYLMFLVLNILYNKYLQQRKSPVWILVVPTIGLAFTGSKTGFVLLCVSVLLLFKSSNIINKILLIMFGLIIALKIGLFNTLIYRFTTGSLTSGRSEKWIEITSMNIFPIKFFTGYGNGFTFILNSYVDWASAAFEYPIRMFSLEMGIIMTIMIYLFIMVIPIIILMKRGHWDLLLSYLIVFADINTFNGIAILGDKMMILSLFIFLILNLSKLIYMKDDIKEV
ncbi:hypothetical protein D2A34_11925 [Clostridium chromiireducens]|uniref:O-antigen ligase domain-containing protein n=2 Tax=Clostridium chromiireducens TaxID=225345 RepID=A0A399ILL0_9CLOT|nr:hypothetical protein D2A34_11925 [Clostridium chromiireducens]